MKFELNSRWLRSTGTPACGPLATAQAGVAVLHIPFDPTGYDRRLNPVGSKFGFAFALAIAFLIVPIAHAQKKAQAPPVEEKIFECRQATEAIRIDGKATEKIWTTAQEIDFLIPWSKSGPKPLTATSAKVLWDDTGLYFLAEMEDSDLYGDVKEKDGRLWENDVFELFFKPHEDQPGYYEYQVNSAGATLDIFYPRFKAGGYNRFKSDRKMGLTAKVVLDGTLNQWEDTDKGWSVEGKIPWADFEPTGGKPKLDDVWRFNLCRYDYSVHNELGVELSVSGPGMNRDFHGVNNFSALKFTGPWDPKAELPERLQKVKGFVGSKVHGSPEPPLPYRAEPALPDHPIYRLITFKFEPGTGRMIYVDQPEGIKHTRVMRYDPTSKKAETLLEPNETVYSICFHPDYARNGYLFLGYLGPTGATRDERRAEIMRYTVPRDKDAPIDPASAHLIINWQSGGHTGAAMAFGPDGMFYVTTGDGTGDSDTNLTGQDLSQIYAKLLRLDIENPDPGKGYSVPKDNPFVGQPNVFPETYAYGFRNPWRITWDKKLNRPWVGQNGQDRLEQIYLVNAGENYGWSVYEGSRIFYENRKRGPHPIIPPTLEYDHGISRSLTGGIVYEGDKLSELKGAYVCGDYATGKIWAARHDGKKVTWHEEIADTSMGITDFGTDPVTGDLLVSDYKPDESGGLYRLVPNPPNPKAPGFPRKLSETGLFTSVPKHEVNPALLPYDVVVPQWADGAVAERYLMMPAGEPVIAFNGGSRGWNLPDGTLVMQTLGFEKGDARRRIETRLMTRQEKEWIGYSYVWNDDQTDAELVEAAGKEFEVDGRKWKVPSRAECMICHSRAANYVLGLHAGQLNRTVDYGDGFAANQLQVMDWLGLFKAKGAKASAMKNPPETYDHFVDPFDESEDLDARARSYLHASCSHCHVEAGGGNSTMNLRTNAKPELLQVINAVPNHGDQGLGTDARIVVPGDPSKSILFNRVAKTGPGSMPPMGAQLPDHRAMGLLLQWIVAGAGEPNDK